MNLLFWHFETVVPFILWSFELHLGNYEVIKTEMVQLFFAGDTAEHHPPHLLPLHAPTGPRHAGPHSQQHLFIWAGRQFLNKNGQSALVWREPFPMGFTGLLGLGNFSIHNEMCSWGMMGTLSRISNKNRHDGVLFSLISLNLFICPPKRLFYRVSFLCPEWFLPKRDLQLNVCVSGLSGFVALQEGDDLSGRRRGGEAGALRQHHRQLPLPQHCKCLRTSDFMDQVQTNKKLSLTGR